MRYSLLLLMFTLSVSCSQRSDSTVEDANDGVGDDLEEYDEELEETEEEEMERLQAEEQQVYDELSVYDGSYKLYTESEGAEGTLELEYLGDRSFKFKLGLVVAGVCEGVVEDTAFLDRTQHAMFASDNCLLHFNLLGDNIEIVEPEGCDLMEGECTFSGVYELWLP